MIEFILANFWTCLVISCIPFMIVYPWAHYKSKKADEQLVKDLAGILKGNREDSS
jgi:hypothetical protein